MFPLKVYKYLLSAFCLICFSYWLIMFEFDNLLKNLLFFTNSWRNSEQRWFFIVTSHGVCATDGGYIVTVDNVGHCNYDDRLGYPQFLYSPNYLSYSMFDEGTVSRIFHYENMPI